MRDTLGFSEEFQRLWPPNKPQIPWDTVSSLTLSLCAAQPLLYPQQQHVLNAASPPSSSFYRKDGWIAVKSAVLLPSSPSIILSPDEEPQLTSLLVLCNVPVVHCRSTLRDILEKGQVCAAIASPEILRTALRRASNERNSNTYASLVSSVYKFAPFLLSYCTRDMSSQDIGTSIQGNTSVPKALSLWNQLHDLPLLPIRDGSLGRIVIYSRQQVEAIDAMLAMDFPYLLSLTALSRCNFKFEVS